MGPVANGDRMPPAILVTGGAGYVGSHTVLSLLEKQTNNDFDIVVVDNLSNAYQAQGEKKPESIRIIEELTGKTIHFYDIDIRDKEALSRVFQNHSIEYVIHFAALKAVGESVQKPLEYYQVNISGTCSLFETMRANGVFKLVYSSSCTVYGEPEKLPLDENHPTGRGMTSPYGKSKYFCEEIMKDLCISDKAFWLVYSSSCTVYGEPEKLPLDENHPTGRGMTSPYGKSKYFCEEIMKDLCISDKRWVVLSLRYFNPVGAHRSGRIGEDPAGIPNNLMPYISQVAVGRLKELQVFGNDYPTVDGTGVRDYIHVEDLAEGHVKAVRLLSQPGFSGFHAVNLGTGTGYSVLEMVAAFEAASGRKIPYKIVGRREGDIAANYADVSLSQRLLGWRATRTLADMCADTWRWQSQHPNGFKK